MTDLLTLEALAAMLDMTPAHIRDRLSKSRGFPDAIRVGQQLRWRRSEIDDWLESRRVSASARRTKRKVAA